MDPKTHHRFLEYIELCEGFLRGGMQKLDRDSFPPLDAEYQVLFALERKGLLDAEQARRIVVLRRILLRD
ncbi:MAG: hypothetical protein DRJ42_07120 [Deltaproteobacteria bacterium]|nr:MAG: hypothetical protein DRJ42_07120 [Deltaproteobacteria bacterium]